MSRSTDRSRVRVQDVLVESPRMFSDRFVGQSRSHDQVCYSRRRLESSISAKPRLKASACVVPALNNTVSSHAKVVPESGSRTSNWSSRLSASQPLLQKRCTAQIVPVRTKMRISSLCNSSSDKTVSSSSMQTNSRIRDHGGILGIINPTRSNDSVFERRCLGATRDYVYPPLDFQILPLSSQKDTASNKVGYLKR